MARVQEFYKGRRKKKNLAIIPFIVLLALVSVTLVTFYGMQKYAVITKDGVSVELLPANLRRRALIQLRFNPHDQRAVFAPI